MGKIFITNVMFWHYRWWHKKKQELIEDGIHQMDRALLVGTVKKISVFSNYKKLFFGGFNEGRT
jgi:hypothetical protein